MHETIYLFIERGLGTHLFFLFTVPTSPNSLSAKTQQITKNKIRCEILDISKIRNCFDVLKPEDLWILNICHPHDS